MTSSSTMKSSATNSDVVAAAAADLGAALVGELRSATSAISVADDAHQLALVVEDASISLASRLLLAQLFEDGVDLQPRQLVELQLEDRVGLLVGRARSASSASAAASALPSDLRMIRIASSSASKTIAKPSRMWMRRSQLARARTRSAGVTTSSRKSRNSRSIAARSSRGGRRDLPVLRRHEAGEVDVEALLERRVLVEVRHHHGRDRRPP